MKILGDLRTDTNVYELMDGGEGGIRTPETFKGFTRFPGVRLKPLGHLSKRDSSQIAQRPDCNRKDFENYLSFNFFPLWEKCKIKGYPEKYNPK